MNVAELRAHFPITREKAYLFNGNICPCATPVRDAMARFLEVWTCGGDECWAVGHDAFEAGKALFAKLVGTTADTIVGIGNTTTGINIAAGLIRPGGGQNVVVTELEHMSNVYPWLAMRQRGVEVRYVPQRDGAIDMGEFAAAIDDETAAVSISHVTMGTGYRFNLDEVCSAAHEHGARVVVDAAQSAGAVPIDVTRSGVDLLAAPSFKWMFGPLGAGFLYVCPELIETCDPPLPGWFGVVNPGDNDLHEPKWHPSAHKFERGVPAMIAFAGAAAGLKLLDDFGCDKVFERTSALATYLYDALAALDVTIDTPSSPAHRAGIIAVKLPGHDALCEQLEQAGIHCGNWLGRLVGRIKAYFEKDLEKEGGSL